MSDPQANSPFDEATRAILPSYLGNLPHAVQLRMWGDPKGSYGEREAARLLKGLADDFDQIEMLLLPRQEAYPYYPVLGVFERSEAGYEDRGVRLIGLPAGVQITSLIAAIQAVSFQGTTIEARTRIELSRLNKDVTLELLSSAEDELGTELTKALFGLAVASKHVRSFLIMADVFPEVMWRYSVRELPHLVINGRVHVSGHFSEESLLRQIAAALGG